MMISNWKKNVCSTAYFYLYNCLVVLLPPFNRWRLSTNPELLYSKMCSVSLECAVLVWKTGLFYFNIKTFISITKIYIYISQSVPFYSEVHNYCCFKYLDLISLIKKNVLCLLSAGWQRLPIINQHFLSPAHENRGWGDIVITMSGRASVFRFRTISLKPLAGLLLNCIHTSLRGCRCAFWGFWPLT